MYGRTILFLLGAALTALTLYLFSIGIEQSLFWKYAWYDTMLHFLGGVSAGFGVVWALSVSIRTRSFVVAFLGVLAVGVAWEVFEILIGFPKEANYAFDTGMDIFMDLIGGMLAIGCSRFVIRT